TRGLDLPVRDVRGLQRLDAVLAERHLGAALGPAFPAGVVRLTEALGGLARHQHGLALLPVALRAVVTGRGRCTGGRGRLGLTAGPLPTLAPVSRGRTAGIGAAGGRTGRAGTPTGPLTPFPA